MASTIVGLVLLDLLHVQLLDVTFHDDEGEIPGEYGLLLELVPPGEPLVQARTVVTQWTALLLDDEGRDPERCATFVAALARDLGSIDRVEPTLIGLPANLLGAALRGTRDDRGQLRDQLSAARAETAALEASRALKVGRAVTGPANVARGYLRDRTAR